MSESYISAGQFHDHAQELGARVAASGFEPEIYLGLTIGGMPLVDALGDQAGAGPNSRLCLPVHKDTAGMYSLDPSFVELVDIAGKRVLVLDDSQHRGLLGRDVVASVNAMTGIGRSAVLIANTEPIDGKPPIPPYYTAATCAGKPGTFFWEDPRQWPQITGGYRCEKLGPESFMLALPGALLQAAAIAKQHKIPSHQIASLPINRAERVIDERVVRLGKCAGKQIVIVGADHHEVDIAADFLQARQATPLRYVVDTLR